MISLNLITIILCALILLAVIILIGLMISANSNASKLRDELGRNLNEQALQTEQKLENIRSTMERSLASLQDDNTKQLDKMRQTVDEKLQKTLEERLGQSFKLVSDRLEQVHKGLGEMQGLASGVGDLKKVLANVKTRGTLGEIRLGAILEEILLPEQYEENCKPIPGKNEIVEFAIRLPGDGDEVIYLPVDSKFPMNPYSDLIDANDEGDKETIKKAEKILDQRIKEEAKSINNKYIQPPFTTDFAVLFLPVEGLYAEVVRRGLVEELQRSYKVNIAGPSTMAALLNSLQMGFKTLAIQKRSGEVWEVLEGVKDEFGKFGEALERARKRIGQADSELDVLINTRSNMMNRKLKDVTSITEGQEIISERSILDVPDDDFGEEDEEYE